MTRRTKLWLYGSLLFALLNAGRAGRAGEGQRFVTKLGQQVAESDNSR